MAEMQWTDYSLDEFIAPKLSKLTTGGANELPIRDNLLPEFVLNSIFTVRYGNELKKNTLNLIRHVEHAALNYNAGRICLLDYLGEKRGRRVSAYFNAVSHFESNVAHLNMARWLTMRIVRPEQKKLFERGSGCVDEQLQEINNQIKHLHEKISQGELPENHNVLLWLTNEGLETPKYSVTFADLARVLADCYGVTLQIARELPKRLAAQLKGKIESRVLQAHPYGQVIMQSAV